jgi:hypothetical protein
LLSAAAPPGGIRQHEQIQTGEQEQGKREEERWWLPREGDPVLAFVLVGLVRLTTQIC